MRVHLVCLSVLLAVLTMSSSGCIVLAAGAGAAGTVAYMRGDLESEVRHNIDDVYTATQKATEELRLHVITSDGGKDALCAEVVARDAADKRVAIKLKSVTQNITKLSIRVGTFGDQTKQRLIYDKIRDNLKAASPQTPQTSQASAAAPAQLSAQAPPTPSPQSLQAAPAALAAPPAQNPPVVPSPQEPSQTPPSSAAPVQAPPTPPNPSAAP